MKLSKLIKELQTIQLEMITAGHGDIECQIQSNPAHDGKGIVNDTTIFVVTEQYQDGMFCNLRTWPY